MKKTIGLWKLWDVLFLFFLFMAGINLKYVLEIGMYFSYSNDDILNEIYSNTKESCYHSNNVLFIY